MPTNVEPPVGIIDPSTGLPDGWMAVDSSNDDKTLDPKKAGKMDPNKVDWHTTDTADGRYITWDADREQWLLCDETTPGYITKVYDPKTGRWSDTE